MATIVINHVMVAYLIPVIRKMVYVQIQLDVSLDGGMDSCTRKKLYFDE
jgi:hypothetical protein